MIEPGGEKALRNVILIIADTFRRDNLRPSAQGGPRTPHLDRFFAERAASVERYYCGSFPTGPNRTDVVTGRAGWPRFPWQPVAQSSANHLARLFGDAGYLTQLICDSSHLIQPNLALFPGFHAWYCERGQEGDTPLLHANDPIPAVVPHAKTFPIPPAGRPTLADRHRWHNRYFELEEQTFSYRTARTTVRWLEENYRSPQPFFLWVDFFDPHEPWDAPEYLVRRYDPDYTGTPMVMPNYGLASRYTPAELANLRAHYLAETELVDRHVGRVLEKIEDLELWHDTVVVFASDHGTSLGEHGRTSKINRDPDDPRYWTLSPELSHIPLLVAAPGVTAGIRHSVFAQPVDLMPTLFDLSGVAAGGPVTTPEPLHGHSLAGALRGRAGGPRGAALAGSCPGGLAAGGDWPGGINTPFLVTDDYGYAPVGEDGAAQLFDLAADPLAERPLGAGKAALADAHARFTTLLQEIDPPPALVEYFAERAPGRK